MWNEVGIKCEMQSSMEFSEFFNWWVIPTNLKVFHSAPGEHFFLLTVYAGITKLNVRALISF